MMRVLYRVYTGVPVVSTTYVSEIRTTTDECSAAWSACHLKRVSTCLVSTEMLKSRLLK